LNSIIYIIIINNVQLNSENNSNMLILDSDKCFSRDKSSINKQDAEGIQMLMTYHYRLHEIAILNSVQSARLIEMIV